MEASASLLTARPTISVFDLNGRAALRSKGGNSLSGCLDKGIYIVNVRSEGLVASRKVTVN